MRIEHAHLSGPNSFNLVGIISELKDIAGQTLDGKVFIKCADKSFGWLEDDSIIRGVGNRAAIGYRRQASAATSTEAMIDRIMVQVSPAASTARGEAFRQHADNFVKFFTGKISKGISTTYHFEQCIFCPFFRRDGGDNLLRQNIQRLFRNRQMIQFGPSH